MSTRNVYIVPTSTTRASIKLAVKNNCRRHRTSNNVMKETSRTEQVPKHRTTRPTSWLKVLDVEERESSIRKHQGEEKGGKKGKRLFSSEIPRGPPLPVTSPSTSYLTLLLSSSGERGGREGVGRDFRRSALFHWHAVTSFGEFGERTFCRRSVEAPQCCS